MKAKDIIYTGENYKYLFELPYGYGYDRMLTMAQFVIDYYLSGKVGSFRTSILPGSKEKEYKCLLQLHGNRVDRCKRIQKEHGVIYLSGKSSKLDDDIEIVWFNQTNIIGVASHFGDKYHETKIEMMLESIIGNCNLYQ
mgnify:CR=1 FL=1